MKRSDLLLAVTKIDNSACPIDATRQLIFTMHRKIENAYVFLFAVEESAKNTKNEKLKELFQVAAESLRKALES